MSTNWTEEEDERLRQLVEQHGAKKWSLIASQLTTKGSKQCRRRWKNFLSADLKKGGWTPEEDDMLLQGHERYGNKWTEIAKLVGGRTDNAVKNRWCALNKRTDRTAKRRGGTAAAVSLRSQRSKLAVLGEAGPGGGCGAGAMLRAPAQRRKRPADSEESEEEDMPATEEDETEGDSEAEEHKRQLQAARVLRQQQQQEQHQRHQQELSARQQKERHEQQIRQQLQHRAQQEQQTKFQWEQQAAQQQQQQHRQHHFVHQQQQQNMQVAHSQQHQQQQLQLQQQQNGLHSQPQHCLHPQQQLQQHPQLRFQQQQQQQQQQQRLRELQLQQQRQQQWQQYPVQEEGRFQHASMRLSQQLEPRLQPFKHAAAVGLAGLEASSLAPTKRLAVECADSVIHSQDTPRTPLTGRLLAQAREAGMRSGMVVHSGPPIASNEAVSAAGRAQRQGLHIAIPNAAGADPNPPATSGLEIRVYKELLTPCEIQYAKELNDMDIPLTINLDDYMEPPLSTSRRRTQDALMALHSPLVEPAPEVLKWLQTGCTPRLSHTAGGASRPPTTTTSQPLRVSHRGSSSDGGGGGGVGAGPHNAPVQSMSSLGGSTSTTVTAWSAGQVCGSGGGGGGGGDSVASGERGDGEGTFITAAGGPSLLYHTPNVKKSTGKGAADAAANGSTAGGVEPGAGGVGGTAGEVHEGHLQLVTKLLHHHVTASAEDPTPRLHGRFSDGEGVDLEDDFNDEELINLMNGGECFGEAPDSLAEHSAHLTLPAPGSRPGPGPALLAHRDRAPAQHGGHQPDTVVTPHFSVHEASALLDALTAGDFLVPPATF